MHDGTCTGQLTNVALVEAIVSCGCPVAAIACPELTALFVEGQPVPRFGETEEGQCPACGMRDVTLVAVRNEGNDGAIIALAQLGDPVAVMLAMARFGGQFPGRHARPE